MNSSIHSPLSSSTSIGCPIGNRGRCIILSLGGWQTPYLVRSLSDGMRIGRFGIGCIHGRGMRIRNSNTTRNFQLPWTIGSMPATGVACYAIRIWRPLCLTCYCILTVSVTRWKRLSSCQTTSTCYSVFLLRIICSPWCSPGKDSRRVKSIGNWEKTGGCGSRITGIGCSGMKVMAEMSWVLSKKIRSKRQLPQNQYRLFVREKERGLSNPQS